MARPEDKSLLSMSANPADLKNERIGQILYRCVSNM